jgi:hypothetical protein
MEHVACLRREEARLQQLPCRYIAPGISKSVAAATVGVNSNPKSVDSVGWDHVLAVTDSMLPLLLCRFAGAVGLSYWL